MGGEPCNLGCLRERQLWFTSFNLLEKTQEIEIPKEQSGLFKKKYLTFALIFQKPITYKNESV